jgi:hypothetical protein
VGQRLKWHVDFPILDTQVNLGLNSILRQSTVIKLDLRAQKENRIMPLKSNRLPGSHVSKFLLLTRPSRPKSLLVWIRVKLSSCCSCCYCHLRVKLSCCYLSEITNRQRKVMTCLGLVKFSVRKPERSVKWQWNT